jgi:hypothetical protein
MTAANRGASVRARLLNRAMADRIDFNLILTRYSFERLLYRLGFPRSREIKVIQVTSLH